MTTAAAPTLVADGMGLRRGEIVLRASAWYVVGWLALTLLPVLRHSSETGSAMPAAAHGVALAVALAAVLGRDRTPWLRVLHSWLALILGPFLYMELHWVIAGVGMTHADELIRAVESVLFPSDPSRTLATAVPVVAVSELLHGAYLSYYGMVYLPPLLLYRAGRQAEFAATITSTVAVFAVCFVVFVLLPVDGPRYTVAAAAPDGPLRQLTLAILEAGSSRGTAFPSAHVGVAVAAAICATRFQPRLALVLWPASIGLAVSTVYGGFHYVVDVIAGAAVGAICAATVSRFAVPPRARSGTEPA
jgi:hypothetical protein